MKCLACGKEIKSYKSTEGKKKYCSKECRLKMTHEFSNCAFCGKEYSVAKSLFKIKTYKYKTCSKECFMKYKIKLKNKKIKNKTWTCNNCGIEFNGYRNNKTNLHFCSQACSRKYMKGENSPFFSGGSTINKAGYKLIKVGEKYLYEHRIILEEHLCRKLKTNEIVHHIDENKLNNSIDNLIVLDKKEHDKLHTTRRHRSEKKFGNGGSQKNSRHTGGNI